MTGILFPLKVSPSVFASLFSLPLFLNDSPAFDCWTRKMQINRLAFVRRKCVNTGASLGFYLAECFLNDLFTRFYEAGKPVIRSKAGFQSQPVASYSLRLFLISCLLFFCNVIFIVTIRPLFLRCPLDVLHNFTVCYLEERFEVVRKQHLFNGLFKTTPRLWNLQHVHRDQINASLK